MDSRREPLMEPTAPVRDSPSRNQQHPRDSAEAHQGKGPWQLVPLQTLIMLSDVVCALYSAIMFFVYVRGLAGAATGVVQLPDGYAWLVYMVYSLGVLFSAALFVWAVRCFLGVCRRRTCKVRSNMSLFESFGILFLSWGIFDAIGGRTAQAISEFAAAVFAGVAWYVGHRYLRALISAPSAPKDTGMVAAAPAV